MLWLAVLSDTPRRAAIALVVKRAVVCPARFLWWRVKVDVADVNPRSQRHAERLNRAIEILVIKRVLVVPDSREGLVTLSPMNQMPSLPGSGSI